MDWRKENEADEALARLLGLATEFNLELDDEEIRNRIRTFNTRREEVVAALLQVVIDRTRLHTFEVWQGRDAATIIAARNHVESDTWAALLAARQVLDDRLALIADGVLHIEGCLAQCGEAEKKKASRLLYDLLAQRQVLYDDIAAVTRRRREVFEELVQG